MKDNTEPLEIKPQPDTTGSQDSKEQIPDKVVMPDECGDSLWDDVLAQYPDLTTIVSKPTVTESDPVPSDSKSVQPNHE